MKFSSNVLETKIKSTFSHVLQVFSSQRKFKFLNTFQNYFHILPKHVKYPFCAPIFHLLSQTESHPTIHFTVDQKVNKLFIGTMPQTQTPTSDWNIYSVIHTAYISLLTI